MCVPFLLLPFRPEARIARKVSGRSSLEAPRELTHRPEPVSKIKVQQRETDGTLANTINRQETYRKGTLVIVFWPFHLSAKRLYWMNVLRNLTPLGLRWTYENL